MGGSFLCRLFIWTGVAVRRCGEALGWSVGPVAVPALAARVSSKPVIILAFDRKYAACAAARQLLGILLSIKHSISLTFDRKYAI